MFPKITSLHTFVLAVLFLTTALTGRALPVSFRSEIAPLLLAQCQGCHGAEKAKGDYRVDSYTELMGPWRRNRREYRQANRRPA
jgi:cytochrome c553